MDAEKIYDYLAATAQADIAEVFLNKKEVGLTPDALKRRANAMEGCFAADLDYDKAKMELEEGLRTLEGLLDCTDEAKLARARELLDKKCQLEEKIKAKTNTVNHSQLVEKQQRLAQLKKTLADKKAGK